MRKVIFPYIATTLLCVLIFACQSGTEPASAKSAVVDTAKKIAGIRINYADTTTAEYKRTINRLDSFFEKKTRLGFNGSVLIGTKGKVIYERYYGKANRTKGIDLSPENAVQLASTSKTFTGAAILYLYQQKYLNIDDHEKD